MNHPMASRQRLKIALTGAIPDRVPMVDISYWPGTLERWQREGLPEGVHPADHFGLDRIELFYIDGSLRLPTEVIEENERWRIYRDANGLLIKEWRDWRISYSPPVRLDCRVKTWDDWRAVKGRLAVEADRLPEAALQAYQEWRRQDRFVVISPPEPMWYLLEHLTGFETGLPMLVEQPDLCAEILTTYTDFLLGMCRLCVEQGMVFDGLWFFSDLCYKNGLLFSPQLGCQLLVPCHQRVRDWCREQDMAFMFHSDGDLRELIPLLIAGGLDCIQPIEARAGNDVRELKRLYDGQIVLFGNINADVMAQGTDEELEAEIAGKITAAKQGGGYIYHSDHSIPPTVSLERYRKVIELVRRYGKYDEVSSSAGR